MTLMTEEEKRLCILILIRDTIVNAKLINTLQRIGIEASLYDVDCQSVVFRWIGIPEEKITDELYTSYRMMLIEGEGIDLHESKDEVMCLADRIYCKLVALK